jgi:DNA-directed RNA polymerase specialized sigma24 family protein
MVDRKERTMTQAAFDQLLAQLDPDRYRAEQKLAMLLRNLADFFSKRNCSLPDDYAAETIYRAVEYLAAWKIIGDVRSFLYGVANNMLKEDWYDLKRRQKMMDELKWLQKRAAREPAHDDVRQDRKLACMRHCLQTLQPDKRETVLMYDWGKERTGLQKKIRKELAEQLQIDLNTLRKRVFDTKQRLRICYEDCLDRQQA